MMENQVKSIGKEEAADMLRQMYEIRAFEEQAEKSYMMGKIHGTMHLSIGQEASAVGSISTIELDDYILGHHRGHGLCIAKGADLKRMTAELFGRKDGYCKGKGGSMHIADFSIGFLGANGVVAGGLPIITGAGLSIKLRKTDQVAVAIFGSAIQPWRRCCWRSRYSLTGRAP